MHRSEFCLGLPLNAKISFVAASDLASSPCLRVRMSLARSVASLTTGHHIRTRHLHRCMQRLRELRKFGTVTGAAPANSGVFLTRLRPDRPHRN